MSCGGLAGSKRKEKKEKKETAFSFSLMRHVDRFRWHAIEALLKTLRTNNFIVSSLLTDLRLLLFVFFS